MKIINILIIIYLKIHNDNRGNFYEIWNKKTFSKFGINNNFVQDNFSFSKHKGTFRGLHFQKPPFSQAKLIRCSRGSIIDYAVDIRKNSKTYGKVYSIKLTSINKFQIFIPIGFLHGFITLENNTEVNYKVSKFYNTKFEQTISYNDKILDLKFPKSIKKIILSKKDINGISFESLKSPYRIKFK